MIQKLRRNFIIVAMCSTFVVLAVIIGIANAVNYVRVIKKADNLLQILEENNAVFPKEYFREKIGIGKPNKSEKPNKIGGRGMSAETPYETRFFSINLDTQGEIISTDTGNIAAIETEDAITYAQKVLKGGHKKGFIEDYRYGVFEKENKFLVIFVDCGRELEAIHMFAFSSLSISVAGLLAVFILVIIFSKKVFLPVEESYKRQKRFITDASHELKTPLAVISANVEVLEMEGQENTWTDSIRRQTKRLTSLTEQMVALSRMDEMGEQHQKVDFSISDAIQETLDTFQTPANNLGKNFQFEIEKNLTFHGDEALIRQMISLLMDNAIKYSSNDKPIFVSLKKEKKYYVFQIYNGVEEIPKGNLDILFERFYRLDSSHNSETGGSGIGLSIVKAIVEVHGGKISAFSEDGKSLSIAVNIAYR